MGKSNVDFVQGIYAAFGKEDVAAVMNSLAPDVEWLVNGRRSDYPTLGVWKGRAEVQKFFTLVGEHENFSEFTPKDFHVAGDVVFVLGHYAGTIATTGRAFESDWLHMFTIKDGKVAQFREFTDTAQFADAYRR